MAIFLIFWLRRPESLLHASFWAEDGSQVFRGQLTLGFWRALIEPYSGYLNTSNRLIAGLLSALPYRWTPTAYSFCAILIQAVSCAAFALPNFRRLVKSDALRATCCVVAAAAVPTSVELIGTICNLHWFLSLLSLLFLVVGGQRTTRKTIEICLTVMQVVIALSAPTTLLFVPFLLWQLKTKTGWLKVRPAVHLAALCFQVWVMRQLPMEGPKPKLHFNTLFVSTLTSGISRCVLAPVIGARYLLQDTDAALFAKMAIALIVCVAGLTWTVGRLRGSKRIWLFWSALYVGFGSVLMAMAGRGFGPAFLTVDGIKHIEGQRYFWVGACIFIFCVAFILETFAASGKPALAVGLMGAVFVLGAIRNFSNPPLNDFDWKESAAKLENWETARQRHEKVGPISLPINPPGWALILDGDH
jgi:hypothetical protein